MTEIVRQSARVTSIDSHRQFDHWWKQLCLLSDKADWDLQGTRNEYRDYYDDGDTPEEALDYEMRYVIKHTKKKDPK